ncbi:hypothetical protein BBJ28_00009915 [Nothophytophthora sp. Chile5]|nr:hypothetical protein BBJ28_00009915 [Nothophytophthora sp. Chile5]
MEQIAVQIDGNDSDGHNQQMAGIKAVRPLSKASAKKGNPNEGRQQDTTGSVKDTSEKVPASSQDSNASSEQQTPLKPSRSTNATKVVEKSAIAGVQKPPAVVDTQGDVVMINEDGAESEERKLTPSTNEPVAEQGVEPVTKEEAEQHTSNDTSKLGPRTRTPLAKEGADSSKSASPAAVDVNSIKMDVLKALAEARSTIAGIKQGAVEVSVPKPTSPEPVIVSTNTTKDVDMQQNVSEPPQKKDEASLLSPQKADTLPATTIETSAADDFDMFSMAALDDHDDAMTSGAGVAAITVNEVSLQSNCDDAEGYYSTTIGEVLNGKYRVLGAVGKGVFSTVLRCQCINPLRTASGGSMEMVAVKLIRNNDVMRDAAQTELKLLNELGGRDPRDKKHCIRLLDSFSHRNHVAMVFEPMQMNVREAMKKFGGKGGISIQAVRVFSKHLLIALNHLDSCQVIHADIKPDNILLDEKQTTIKLCDFGSAFKVDDGKQDPTPYLVSRFYRAPEIVLGLVYDKAVDMWSVGCCLFEMFTGKVMFPGSTNNEMLKLFMELKGKIPNKLIKKHRQAYVDRFEMEPHFTEDLKFCSRESDRVTGK